jgi:hypothetical protein
MYFSMPAAQSLSLHPLLEQQFSPRGFADTPVESEKKNYFLKQPVLLPPVLINNPGALCMQPKKTDLCTINS